MFSFLKELPIPNLEALNISLMDSQILVIQTDSLPVLLRRQAKLQGFVDIKILCKYKHKM